MMQLIRREAQRKIEEQAAYNERRDAEDAARKAEQTRAAAKQKNKLEHLSSVVNRAASDLDDGYELPRVGTKRSVKAVPLQFVLQNNRSTIMTFVSSLPVRKN
ncbi:hypothetical protein ISN44_As09g009250 [Arabidopsis suecica]|uniref:Uncharacterized protein n=1 Tax=Arabidopsis suecica TaxID=45249 RepID=A0A8T2AHX0_ARASU|nr:hypothetical protein ISN44_As09g009250 [Arabidopsis suecica]